MSLLPRASRALFAATVSALALGACATGGGGTPDVVVREASTMDVRPDVPAPPPDVQMPPPDVQLPDVPPPPDAPDICTMASTCEACTGLAGCGFCYGNNTCKRGGAGGPADGNCGPSLWAFGAAATACWGPEPAPEPTIEPGPEAGTPDVAMDVAADASNPCSDSRSCDDCSGRAECGWCAATATCLVGTRSGPTGSTCTAPNWRYLASECAGDAGADADAGPDPCGAYQTCGDCTPRAGCGFCTTDNSCRTGTSMGATRGGACTGTAWKWISTECAPPADPCRAFGGCDTCAADTRCGWCPTNNTCTTFTAGARCSDMTTTPVRSVAACVTAVDPCSLVMIGTGQCLACTAIPGCGLCREGNRCLRGTAPGPMRTTCAAGSWVFSPLACF